MTQKYSTYIHYQEAKRFLSAIKKFEALGKPVNTLVTVNLDKGWLGITPCECSAFARQSLQRLRVMFNRIRCPWAVVWVLENKPVIGIHLHVLIHRSPEYMSDAQSFRKLLKRAFKAHQYKAGTIRFCKFRSWYKSYAENKGNLERYFLKGIRPVLAGEFEIKPQVQGKIIGKRIGVMG